MKIRPVLAVAAVAAASVPAPAHADTGMEAWCASETSAHGAVLCSSTTLQTLTIIRNQLFAKARNTLSDDAYRALLADQKNWINTSAAQCGVTGTKFTLAYPIDPNIVQCFVRASLARNEYLREMLGMSGAPQPDAAPQPATPPAPAATPAQDTPELADAPSLPALDTLNRLRAQKLIQEAADKAAALEACETSLPCVDPGGNRIEKDATIYSQEDLAKAGGFTGIPLKDAFKEELRQIDAAVSIAKDHGYTCDSVSSWEPYLFGHGFKISCNHSAYTYDFSDHGRGLEFSAE